MNNQEEWKRNAWEVLILRRREKWKEDDNVKVFGSNDPVYRSCLE